MIEGKSIKSKVTQCAYSSGIERVNISSDGDMLVKVATLRCEDAQVIACEGAEK